MKKLKGKIIRWVLNRPEIREEIENILVASIKYGRARAAIKQLSPSGADIAAELKKAIKTAPPSDFLKGVRL